MDWKKLLILGGAVAAVVLAGPHLLAYLEAGRIWLLLQENARACVKLPKAETGGQGGMMNGCLTQTQAEIAQVLGTDGPQATVRLGVRGAAREVFLTCEYDRPVRGKALHFFLEGSASEYK